MHGGGAVADSPAAQQRFDHPFQQIVFQEYVDAVREAQTQVKALGKELQEALEGLVAGAGDASRQLMAFVGLVLSEHSSGNNRQWGAITKAGNAHVRRVLAERTIPGVQAIAWKAQKRLRGRYRHFAARRMPKNKACTAIARELLDFIWAIAWELKQPGSMAGKVA